GGARFLPAACSHGKQGGGRPYGRPPRPQRAPLRAPSSACRRLRSLASAARKSFGVSLEYRPIDLQLPALEKLAWPVMIFTSTELPERSIPSIPTSRCSTSCAG